MAVTTCWLYKQWYASTYNFVQTFLDFNKILIFFSYGEKKGLEHKSIKIKGKNKIEMFKLEIIKFFFLNPDKSIQNCMQMHTIAYTTSML